jgi:hypothetical protein
VLVTGAPVVLNVLRDLVLTLVDYLANLDFEGILNPVVDGLRDGLMSIVQALPSLAGTIIDTILQGVDRLASSSVFSRILGVLEKPDQPRDQPAGDGPHPCALADPSPVVVGGFPGCSAASWTS